MHDDIDANIISCCSRGNLLFCGRTDAVISVWNLEHLQEQGQLKGHKRSVLCLKSALYPATPNGDPEEFLFSSSSDNTIKVSSSSLLQEKSLNFADLESLCF